MFICWRDYRKGRFDSLFVCFEIYFDNQRFSYCLNDVSSVNERGAVKRERWSIRTSTVLVNDY